MMKLLNCYLPVFRLGYEFTQHPEKYADYAFLRETCIELLKQSALNAELEHDKSDCESALLAVVIWLDERVLCSTLPCVAQWRSALLQMQLFQTSIGGELFFTRLAAIPDANISLHRVYLFCLLTGFHGKYTQQDKTRLKQRIEKTKACLPAEWRDWPNQAHLTLAGQQLKINQLTHWQIIKNSRWLWLIIPVSAYGLMLLSGFIYFS
ncbi:DotU family type IV/VI secretion system protein [Hafnia alvei]|uniref:Type IV / VI secretion system protein, DotU family n=1 Tax=Hafnia alvei ATCC 51873 TaxID=1002364 RepID=G9Y4T1_HAFAL|nr:DotU family type IV/VI secretion system protein [Hafnia alvei]EHM44282.1 type IV / VI secretion system protein, DotU family [Hafnia alvei ATCC 51873]QQE44566.1 DotU family type IV/VI secretion system protein [Hafnia alvei]